MLLPPPYRNTEWPQPGGFASNAMYHLEASGPLRQLWDADAGKGSDANSRLTASPVIGGGRIFTLDSEAHVYAFDANSGQEIWDKRLAPKNGTDMPTLWGLLGKPNTIEPASRHGRRRSPMTPGKIFVTSGFGVSDLHGRGDRARGLAPRYRRADRQRAGGQWRARFLLHP